MTIYGVPDKYLTDRAAAINSIRRGRRLIWQGVCGLIHQRGWRCEVRVKWLAGVFLGGFQDADDTERRLARYVRCFDEFHTPH